MRNSPTSPSCSGPYSGLTMMRLTGPPRRRLRPSSLVRWRVKPIPPSSGVTVHSVVESAVARMTIMAQNARTGLSAPGRCAVAEWKRDADLMAFSYVDEEGEMLFGVTMEMQAKMPDLVACELEKAGIPPIPNDVIHPPRPEVPWAPLPMDQLLAILDGKHGHVWVDGVGNETDRCQRCGMSE